MTMNTSQAAVLTETTPAHTSLRAWLMWILAALFYFYENLVQVSPSVMTTELMRDFTIDATHLGYLGALYLTAYAGMQIPVGILVDRYGVRRLLSIASLVCGLGCILFASAKLFSMACIGRIMIGIGSAFAVVCCSKIAATWFPLGRFALLTGLMITVGFLGPVSSEKLLPILIANLDWRQSLLFLGGIGTGLAILVWLIIRDRSVAISVSQTNHATGFFSGLKAVLRSKQTWLASIYGSLMYTPTLVFGGLWGIAFLKQADSLSDATAGSVMAMLFFGWIVGSPFGGWVSDRIGRRKVPMIVGAIGALITSIVIIYISNLPAWTLEILLFLFGFFSSGFLTAFSIVREINPPETSGTAIGFINTLNMVGGAAAQPFVGYLLDLHWHNQMENGVRIYSVENFHFALMAMPISIGIALILLPFIKETYCRVSDK